jgi:hypothetical protein
VTNVFLSHKEECTPQAETLIRALYKVAPGADIFHAADIEKGADWRKAVDGALGSAKCFVLLYTDPALDWSWCFYEAGSFVKTGRAHRPVFCLHPQMVEPPSPIANLQAIRAEQPDVVKWIEDFCRVLNCKTRINGDRIKDAARTIGKLVNGVGPLLEEPLKPYIWIEPEWDGDWNATDEIPEIDFSDALVIIDKDSARALGFANVPKLTLLPFLRQLATDRDDTGKLEFWIKKFFESLQKAVRGKLDFQEAAFFRHENGRIYRPVVVSDAKNASGTQCRLRVIFAPTFASPLTDSPGLVQRLSVGATLAVRTRLEVLDPFLGHTSQVYKNKIKSSRPEDAISRQSPVGGRIVEALDAIWQEAVSHGVRPGEAAPPLFEGATQQEYEKLRSAGLESWERIKKVALAEDEERTGRYPKTERLLTELKQINEDYLAVVLPRIEELLVPAERKCGKRN